MTTREPSSAAESGSPSQFAQTKKNRISRSQYTGDDGRMDLEDEECDREGWNTLSKCFRRVQSALDQNRALIQQVNENHQSKIPDNLAKNVALIREINGNISRVTSLYSDLSVEFSGIIRQHRRTSAAKKNGNREEEEKEEGMNK